MSINILESVINLRVISTRVKQLDYSFKFDGLHIALDYVCSKLVNEQLLKTPEYYSA